MVLLFAGGHLSPLTWRPPAQTAVTRPGVREQRNIGQRVESLSPRVTVSSPLSGNFVLAVLGWSL